MKVLVCEDERFARQSLVKQIKSLSISEDFEIIEAENGEKGFELFKKLQPETVLLDIKMPLVDGLSLLRMIMERSPKTKVMMTSGYAYFSYSQEAINLGAVGYLLKPVGNEDLEKFFIKALEEKALEEKNSEELEILKNSDTISRAIYDLMVFNKQTAVKSISEDFKNKFCAFRVAFLYFPGGYHQELATVVKLIQTVFDKEGINKFKAVSVSKDVLCLVYTDQRNMLLIVKNICKLLLENGYPCFGGISSVGEAICNLNESYQQAVTAAKGHIFLEESVTCYDDLKSGIIDDRVYNESDFSMIRLHVEKGDCDAAVQVIRRLLSHIEKDSRFSVALLENILMKVSTVFVEIVQKNNLLQIQTELMGFDLLLYKSIDELEKEILRRARLICTYILPQSGSKNDNILSIVKSYINDNYNKDISLKYLAQKVVFLNHTYLSHLIHEKTGKSYSTFLREIRIEKAKELLCSTELSITEVATMCGYNDTSQFIRVFKKDVGVTPKKIKDQSK